jgi:hypothetical protein
MRRNEKDTPWEGNGEDGIAGVSIRRNPGCCLLWTCLSYKIMRVSGGPGVLFTVGDPVNLEYYCEGRRATRDEVLHSMETGFPILLEQAMLDGKDAVQELEGMYAKALDLVPMD